MVDKSLRVQNRKRTKIKIITNIMLLKILECKIGIAL